MLLLFFVLYFSLSCSIKKDDPETVENLDTLETLNISYGFNTNQNYDLQLPENKTQTTTKVIVLIHGGGWTSGDKNDLIGVYDYLKNNFYDYTIVNLNYTLADLSTSPVPLQIDDITLFLESFKVILKIIR